jgi:hypothetical protein
VRGHKSVAEWKVLWNDDSSERSILSSLLNVEWNGLTASTLLVEMGWKKREMGWKKLVHPIQRNKAALSIQLGNTLEAMIILHFDN